MNKFLSCAGCELNDLYCDIPIFAKNFPGNAHIKNSDDLSFLFTNKKHMAFYGLKSPEELKGRNVFDMQKTMPDKIPLNHPEKVQLEEENVLKTNKSVIFKGVTLLNYDGFIFSFSSLKTPLFDSNNKIKAILSLSFDSTKNEKTKSLFEKYQQLYKNNQELCNQKFLEYVGISQKDPTLTTRELECLISLSQYKNLKNAAQELTISQKTLETHLHNIKLKLNNYDLSNILKYFISTKYRKF